MRGKHAAESAQVQHGGGNDGNWEIKGMRERERDGEE